VTSERGQSRAFLGWATPTSLVEALFEPSNPRHTIYQKVHALALEAGEKWQKAIDDWPPGAALAAPADLTTDPWSLSWVALKNGIPNPFATEQFLAIELGRTIEKSWKADPFLADPDASLAEKFPRAVMVTEQACARSSPASSTEL
jgi:hypothetical protein